MNAFGLQRGVSVQPLSLAGVGDSIPQVGAQDKCWRGAHSGLSRARRRLLLVGGCDGPTMRCSLPWLEGITIMVGLVRYIVVVFAILRMAMLQAGRFILVQGEDLHLDYVSYS